MNRIQGSIQEPYDNNPKYRENTKVQFVISGVKGMHTGRIRKVEKEPGSRGGSSLKKNRITYTIDGDDGQEHIVREGYINNVIAG